MLAIRMRRVGAKKRPFFRVVVAESASARDGRFVEILGHYYPRARPATIEVDRDRIRYWLERGAQPSDTVRTLIARHLKTPAETAADVPTPPAVEAPVPAPAEPPAAE